MPMFLKEREAEQLNQAARTGRIVLNRKRLPADLSDGRIIRAIDEAVISLDHFFAEDGYVVAQVDRLSDIAGRIRV